MDYELSDNGKKIVFTNALDYLRYSNIMTEDQPSISFDTIDDYNKFFNRFSEIHTNSISIDKNLPEGNILSIVVDKLPNNEYVFIEYAPFYKYAQEIIMRWLVNSNNASYSYLKYLVEVRITND